MRTLPRFFEVEDCLSIGNPVMMEKVKNILKIFTKDKSLGPDGCTVEFYLQLFDLFGREMTKVIYET